MKLAYIDHYILSTSMYDCPEQIIEELAKVDVQCDVAPTWPKFSMDYGGLAGYDGILWHPGIEGMKHLQMIRAMHPDMKLALITYSPEDYEFEVPVFDYWSPAEDIKKAFLNKPA